MVEMAPKIIVKNFHLTIIPSAKLNRAVENVSPYLTCYLSFFSFRLTVITVSLIATLILCGFLGFI